MELNYREFIHDENLIKKLEELHKEKYLLKSCLNQTKMPPLVVEICGLPRTEKTNSIKRISNFFHEGNIRTLVTKEPAEIVKEYHDTSILSNKDFNDLTLRYSIEQLKEKRESNPDIILQDRGVFDNYIWYQMMYENGEISEEQYQSIIEDLNKVLLLTDVIFITTAEPQVIVERDFNEEIFLETRNKTTVDNIIRLQHAIDSLLKQIDNSKIQVIDTTRISEKELAIILSSSIIKELTKKNQNIKSR